MADTISLARYLEPPRPISTCVDYRRGLTVISRLFDPADVPRCRLCPTCTACPEGMCLIVVAGHIEPADAATFSYGDAPAGP